MNAALLDKSRIKQSFAAASATYDQAAALQRRSAIDVTQLAETEGMQGSVLDLGCGTGNLAELLLSAECKPDIVIALDIAASMIEAARCKLNRKKGSKPALNYVCADAERLPFATDSLDGVYSNLALQWCDPLEKVLADLRRILKPGSPLIFSTFGPETLHELKSAWAKVDDLPHVNAFLHEQELMSFLQAAGFSACRIQRTLHISRYASVIDLMRELKQIGAHNSHLARPKNLTGKARMQAMSSAYERHRYGLSIPATFEILLVSARA
ncbi:malonyl-ACP O-methyltransferase BioC [Methylomicrobium sp. Wu6]|uniref:malonyl-ACP O-methyltransferase BioC n=1 Tax=Methylomicrobium sp. Wu6 TaxID=3107928 RepID=UPI002DD66BF7|nr:malonyl-ACP O-methyltransferase BioC [Methylomicrobium sp. Wu6]MEC4750575.1 malonyl-ACP O-methyltransferase BioC [Methylomicrobium sp. Wu6]